MTPRAAIPKPAARRATASGVQWWNVRNSPFGLRWKVKDRRIGSQVWPTRSMIKDFPAYVKMMAGIGVTRLELCSPVGYGAEFSSLANGKEVARILALADEAGFKVGSPREPNRRGGTVCLDLPESVRVCEALLAQDVLLDHRPGVGLRLAPHFYTRDDEVDEVMRRVRVEVEKAVGAAR